MRKRYLITMIVALVLFSLSVYAEKSLYSTGISAENDQIFTNESASFILDVFSDSNEVQRFSLYTDVEWNMYTDPASDKTLKVYPHSQKSTRVLIKPKYEANIIPGAYTVRLYLKNIDTEEVITNSIIVHIKGDADYSREYLPSLRAELRMNKEFDPRETINVNVYVENQNPLGLENVDLTIESEVFYINDNFSIKGLGKQELTYTVNLDDTHPPVTDMAKVSLQTFKDGKMYEFNSVPLEFHIISYGDVKETVEVEKDWFKKKTTYSMKNIANVDTQYKFKANRNIFSAPFKKFDTELKVEEISGKKYYVKELKLGVLEEQVVVEYVNYWPLVIAILVIIVLIILYGIFRSPLLLKKSMVITSAKHGAISGITVQLDLKNRSPKSQYDLEVKDKVPNVFELQKDFEVGTMQPFQILKHERKGTIIKWKIPELDPFEERIITYRLKSRLNIIGRFTLPSASLVFKGKRSQKAIHSNKVIMAHKNQ